MISLNNIESFSIEILETMGIEIEDTNLLNKFIEIGMKIDNSRVYLNKEYIQGVLERVQSDKTIENYSNNINYINISNINKIRDYDGNIKDADIKDYIKSVKILEESKFFDINGGLVIDPVDIDENIKDELLTYINIKSSNKQIVIDADNNKNLRSCLELADINNKKSNVIVTVSNNEVLKISKELSDKLETISSYGNLIILSNKYIRDTNALNIDETIALYNANMIANMVICNVLNENSHIVYAYRNNEISPIEENLVVGNECIKIGKKYNLLTAIEMPSSTQSGANFKSGYESMLSLSSNHQESPNFIITTLGVQDNYNTISFEKIISDMEVLSVSNYVYKDMEVNEKTLALKTVEEGTKTGSFITLKHTAKNCRKYPWFPTIAVPRKNVLSKHPVEIMKDCINEYEEKLISSYKIPTLDENIENNLCSYMLNAGVNKEILDEIDGYLK